MNKEKLSKFHQDNILAAADALFLQYGFEKTTVEMIAKAAEYSKPTVYAYFRSKEEIFAFNLFRYIQKFKHSVFEVAATEQNLTDAYLACCFEAANLKNELPVYYSGIMGALDYKRNSLTEIGAEIRKVSGEINGALLKLLTRAAEEGVFRAGIDVDFAYAYLWSCVNGIVTSPLFARERFPLDESYRAALREGFLNVIRAYLA